MELTDVTVVLDALDARAVRHWVLGGWGVAALVGRQTREHRDLDLAVDARDLDVCLAALDDLGYHPETDWLPVRLEVAASRGRWVDVHPVVFGPDGNGLQAGLDGTTFDYPAAHLVLGAIGGRRVPCISAAWQRSAHTGYDPRPKDLHDVALLDGLADP
ncbi:MAG: nucleotidyltransferase domain-containing protein [Nocardioides sp.]